MIHTPLEVPKRYEDKFLFLLDKHRRLYAAMVNFMDDQLGMFVDALKAKHMWDNTLMIVSSDNGGPIYATGIKPSAVYGGATNAPLKGGKLSDWEGGVRVNAFVSGGFIPAGVRGTESDHYMHIADWYATLCHVVGVDVADSKAEAFGLPPVDSINQWGVLSGASNQSVRTDVYLSAAAYIKGEYKIITGDHVPASWAKPVPGRVLMAGYWHGYGPFAGLNTLLKTQNCSLGCLYNIIQDPYEYHDLALEEPQLLKQMWSELDELNKGIFKPDRGNQSMAACTVGMNEYRGFYGPFVNVNVSA